MKTLILILLLPLVSLGQWDYHAHFWGSATLSFGLHFKLGKQETVKYPAMVFSLGLLKEASDLATKGHWSWMDVRADITGCALGFMVSDIWKRKRNPHKLLESYD